MAKNLMPEVAKLLGVEFGEKFKIRDKYTGKVKPTTYYICDRGLMTNVDGIYLSNKSIEQLQQLLMGYLEIVKLPWEPKENERVWCPNAIQKTVVGFLWRDGLLLLSLKALGMVYRTREEAWEHFADDYYKLTGKKLEG